MKKLYEITEIGRGIHETYALVMTETELKQYLKSKREAYGYIPGIGGDRTYDCFAVLLTAFTERIHFLLTQHARHNTPDNTPGGTIRHI